MTGNFIMDCHGEFCIEVDGKRSLPQPYEGTAVLVVNKKLYLAFTQYQDGAMAGLSPEIIYDGTGEAIPTTMQQYSGCRLIDPDIKCAHEEYKKDFPLSS